MSGVDITNLSSAPVYIKTADKVFITLKPESTNRLSVTGDYVAIDENNIDAAIFSKEDLTINGSGELEIDAVYGHSIVSKDELAVCGAELSVTCQNTRLQARIV